MEEALRLHFLSRTGPNQNSVVKAGPVMSYLRSTAERSSSELLSEEYQMLLFSFCPILNMSRGFTSTNYKIVGLNCAR